MKKGFGILAAAACILNGSLALATVSRITGENSDEVKVEQVVNEKGLKMIDVYGGPGNKLYSPNKKQYAKCGATGCTGETIGAIGLKRDYDKLNVRLIFVTSMTEAELIESIKGLPAKAFPGENLSQRELAEKSEFEKRLAEVTFISDPNFEFKKYFQAIDIDLKTEELKTPVDGDDIIYLPYVLFLNGGEILIAEDIRNSDERINPNETSTEAMYRRIQGEVLKMKH